MAAAGAVLAGTVPTAAAEVEVEVSGKTAGAVFSLPPPAQQWGEAAAATRLLQTCLQAVAVLVARRHTAVGVGVVVGARVVAWLLPSLQALRPPVV